MGDHLEVCVCVPLFAHLRSVGSLRANGAHVSELDGFVLHPSPIGFTDQRENVV